MIKRVSDFIEWGRAFCPVLAQPLKSHAITRLLAAGMYLIIHANYRLAINQPPNLPNNLFLIHLNDKVEIGGLDVFKSHHVETLSRRIYLRAIFPPYSTFPLKIPEFLCLTGEMSTEPSSDFFHGTG